MWSRLSTCQACQRQHSSQLPQPPIFSLLHATAGMGLAVLVTAQMEKSMDQVTSKFELPGGVKDGGLRNGLAQGKEDLGAKGGPALQGVRCRGGLEAG